MRFSSEVDLRSKSAERFRILLRGCINRMIGMRREEFMMGGRQDPRLRREDEGLSLSPILNSSSLRPDRSAETSHIGCFPRPAHVSVGTSGLKYFGTTLGYFRRSLFGLVTSAKLELSRARRLSNSSFSAVIFFARIFVNF